MGMKAKMGLSIVVASVVSAALASGYDVAAFVWPAYQPEPRWAELGIFKAGKGEWQTVWEAKPKWEGHVQPLKPIWGYENEADPKVMEKKIDAAVSHGVNVFIYDWYWFDGRPFLEDALDKGFLGAKNNGKMKFFIMWANHDANEGWDNTVADKEHSRVVWPGAVTAEEFRGLVARWIERYFSRPNYYRIGGRPVLMLYNLGIFIKGLGGVDKARESVELLRQACRDAGLGGVHLMVCDFCLDEGKAKAVGIDSATMYTLAHWSTPRGNPDFAPWAEKAARRFDAAMKKLAPAAYFAHASVGWDQNPRYPASTITPTVLGRSPANRGYRYTGACPRADQLRRLFPTRPF